MTAHLHNGLSQTNVIVSDYVSLCVKCDGNPDKRRAFKVKFQPGGTLQRVNNAAAAAACPNVA